MENDAPTFDHVGATGVSEDSDGLSGTTARVDDTRHQLAVKPDSDGTSILVGGYRSDSDFNSDDDLDDLSTIIGTDVVPGVHTGGGEADRGSSPGQSENGDTASMGPRKSAEPPATEVDTTASTADPAIDHDITKPLSQDGAHQGLEAMGGNHDATVEPTGNVVQAGPAPPSKPATPLVATDTGAAAAAAPADDRMDASINSADWGSMSFTFGTMEMAQAAEVSSEPGWKDNGGIQSSGAPRKLDGTLVGSGGMTHSNLAEILKDVHFREAYGVHRLHVLATNGDGSAISRLLAKKKQSVDVNAVDAVGRTPLVYAVMSKSSGAVAALLKGGADVAVADADGRSPLHWAAFHGKIKVLKLLLSNSTVNVNAVDKERRTALHWATVQDATSAKVVQMLLKAGANIGARDIEGMTPLHWAVYHDSAEICILLLKAGADPRAHDDVEGKTPLHWAAADDNLACVKMLLAAADKDVIRDTDNMGRTALHFCIAEDKELFAKLLLDSKGVDVDARDKSGRTPLHWAAALNKVAFAATLISAGAMTEVEDDEGATPLHFALQHDDVAMVEILLEGGYGGQKVDLKDNNGCTPLVWAVAHGNLAAARLLVAAGADVNTADSTDRTALHTCGFNGNLECMRLLLDKGADPTRLDASAQNTLFPPCTGGHIDVVLLLLEQPGMSATIIDTEKRTLMHVTAIGGHAKLVPILADAGVDAHAYDDRGEAALHYAAFFGHTEVITNLLSAGADMNCIDFDGLSPLHWAAFKGHAEALSALLRAGAYPNFMENVGNKSTPYDYAKSGSHFQCAELIATYGGVDNFAMQEVAAVMVQSSWRAFKARRRVRFMKRYLTCPEEEKVTAATLLQACFRGYKVRKSYDTVRQEHRKRIAALDEKKLKKLAADDEVVASEALRYATEMEARHMARAKELQETRRAEERKQREASERIRTAEQEALANRRTIAQEKLVKKNQFLVEKKLGEGRRKSIELQTDMLNKELRLAELRQQVEREEQEKRKSAAEAEARRKAVAKAQATAKFRVAARLSGRLSAGRKHKQNQAEAAQAAHLRDVKVRHEIVSSEKRRIHTVRVKVRAATVIQRAWRHYAARLAAGLVSPRPPKSPASLETARKKLPPTCYAVAGDVRSGARRRSLQLSTTLRAPSLPPLSGARGAPKGPLRRRADPSRMHRIKLPDILSPEATIAKSKTEVVDTHVEVAALLIQLWWRRYRARKAAVRAELLRTGPGSEAVAALQQQRKDLVKIYAPRRALVKVKVPRRSHRTLPGAAAARTPNHSSSITLPLATVAAPYRKAHGASMLSRTPTRRSRMTTVRLESLGLEEAVPKPV